MLSPTFFSTRKGAELVLHTKAHLCDELLLYFFN